MRGLLLQVWAFSLMFAVVAPSAGAERTDGRTAFVESFVEALNSRNPSRQKELLHPRSLGCANGPAVSFFDEVFAPRIKPPVPAGYKWRITPVPSNTSPLFADKFDYSVRPTHLLQLDFETAPNNSTTFIVQVAQEADRWQVVAACPKPGTTAAAQTAGKARAERAEKVNELIARMPADLRDQLLRLVREGHKIDAIMEYQKATDEDLATAKEVVESLTTQSR